MRFGRVKGPRTSKDRSTSCPSARTSMFLPRVACFLPSFARLVNDMRISSLLLLSAVPAALAQVTADLSASTSTDSDTTITLTRTRTATLTGSVVSESSALASTTSTSLGPRPTANITNGAEQQLRLWGPEGGLVQCQRPSFA